MIRQRHADPIHVSHILCCNSRKKVGGIIKSFPGGYFSFFAPADILLFFKLLSVFTPFFPLPFLLFPPLFATITIAFTHTVTPYL